MNQLGYAALLLCVLTSAYGVVAPLIGVRTGRREWIKSAENSTYAFAAAAVVASIVLLYALVTRDFSNEYVASYTSRGLSWFYTVSAFWAGNAGSMLLWVVLLGTFAAVAVYQNRHKNREILPYVISVLMAVGLFFSLILTVSAGSNPFAEIPGGGPANGQGLNLSLIHI